MVLDLDGDGDGMSDPWETIFRLSPGDPADGRGDADGDGRPNLLEFREGTHPHGLYQRHFAEGVSRADFQTRVHVFDAPATVSGERWPPTVISFLGDDGSRGSRTVGASGAGEPPADGYAPSALLTSSQYSIVVEGERPFAAERSDHLGIGGLPPAHTRHRGARPPPTGTSRRVPRSAGCSCSTSWPIPVMWRQQWTSSTSSRPDLRSDASTWCPPAVATPSG